MSELSPILVGTLCAVIAALPGFVQAQIDLERPIFLLGLGVFAAIIQAIYFRRFSARTRAYDGMADLFIFIHSRLPDDSWIRWFYRSAASLFLYLFGAGSGIEGAAAEASQSANLAIRSRSELWNEGRRRSDVATILAGSISAVFQAPFAGVVFGFEVGAGGRPQAAILSSISAYVATLFISKHMGFENEWVPFFQSMPVGKLSLFWIPVAGALGGVIAFLLIRGVRWFQESVVEIFRNAIWARPLVGGALLATIVGVHPEVKGAPMVSLTAIAMSPMTVDAHAGYFLAKVLLLATVVACFGTIGIFWPLFVIGSSFGLSMFTGAAGIFVGASALWAGVLGAPLTAGILAFEMTRSWQLLIAALVVAFVSDAIRRLFRQKPLVHRDLEARGLSLLDGRSASVLSAIRVRDAMVTDHETVYETDLVKELTEKFLNSRHPFLPVVNRKGEYAGLLTLDLIQEGISSARGSDTFFEVKDLLYKAKTKLKSIRDTDTLASTGGLFGDHPCVAVLNSDARVVGLLFAYSVRAAYEREVARLALADTKEAGVHP